MRSQPTTDVLGAAPRLVRLIAADAHEGPVYAPDEHALHFTSVPRAGGTGPRVDIRRLALEGDGIALRARGVSTVRSDANAANGMTLGHDGRLVVCEQGSRTRPARITRVDRRDGDVETVVEAVSGRPLNSPNDVVVTRDGAIWFTDPSYGHLQGFRPPPARPDAVHRHDPATGITETVVTGMDKPNGLAFSPGERVLYVTDSGANQEPGSFHPDRPHHVLAFDVDEAARLGPGRVLFVTEPGVPDGLKVDAAGRIYASAASGVQVFAPGGDPLGEIGLPGAVNFAFGGPDRDVLFITTDTAVWAAVLNARGA